MKADLSSLIRSTRERAQSAREFAQQSRQRAQRLVLQACVLMQRYDELESQMALKMSMADARLALPIAGGVVR
jgi:hypothetical protein